MKGRPIYVDYMLTVLGSFIIGFVIKDMYSSVNLMISRTSSLAIIVKELGEVSLWMISAVVNIPLLLAVYGIKGWRSIKRTLIAAASLSVSLYMLPYTPFVTGDLLLASLFDGIMTGVGASLALLCKATIGGTGMLAVLFHRKFHHCSIAQIIQVLDKIIVLVGATVFNARFILYALISIYVLAEITDDMIKGMKFSKQTLIIPGKGREIAETIIMETEWGVTALDTVGMYFGLSRQILFCVVFKRKIVQLKEIVQSHDAGAFVIVSNAREVFEERFIEC